MSFLGLFISELLALHPQAVGCWESVCSAQSSPSKVTSSRSLTCLISALQERGFKAGASILFAKAFGALPRLQAPPASWSQQLPGLAKCSNLSHLLAVSGGSLANVRFARYLC